MAKGGGKRQKFILAALAAVFAVILLNNLFFHEGREDTGKSDGHSSFKLGNLPPASMPDVRLDLLEKLNVPVKVTRNIFDPVYRPPVIKPVITPKPVTKPAGAGKPNPNYVPPPPPKTREELETERAMSDIKKFRFVGFIQRKGKLDIFITKDSDYYVSSPGETITEGYYIKEVKSDSLVIADHEHKIKGKEVEITIKADFEGEDADVITGDSAPYVGVGATGGSVGGGPGGGPEGGPSREDPVPATRQRTPPGPEGRRAPTAQPEGSPEVVVVQTGRAATPVKTGGGTEEGSPAPAPLEDHSIP